MDNYEEDDFENKVKDMFGNELEVGDFVISPYGFDKIKFAAISIVRGFTDSSVLLSSYKVKSQWTDECAVVKSSIRNPERIIKMGGVPEDVFEALQKDIE